VSIHHASNAPIDFARMRFPLLASEKLNGFRLIVMIDRLLTKSLNVHANRNLREHLSDLLTLSATGECWVFDCELYSEEMDFAELQSILQSRSAPIPSSIKAHVFDALTFTEFFGSRAMRFGSRVERYQNLIASQRPANAVAVDQRLVSSPSQVLALYESIRASEGEGLMLRDPTVGKWKRTRAGVRDGFYKVKPETLTAPELAAA
jgi:ATP-dependent DNA ligase